MTPRLLPATIATGSLRRRIALLVAAVLLVGTPAAIAATKYKVKASGTVTYHHREAKTKKVEQRGTVKGEPFGTGTLVLRTKLAARKKLEYSIRLTTKNGAVWGNGTANLEVKGQNATYVGTVKLRGGNGRYAKISRSTLKVSGSGPANLRDRTKVSISGSVSY